MKGNNPQDNINRASKCDVSPRVFRNKTGSFARGLSILVLLVLAFSWNLKPAAARDLPGGFYPLAEQPGVGLYRKDYRDGTPDFVLIVDLSTGASVDLLHGHPSENDGKKAASQFAGPNPAFSEAPISGYWQKYAQEQPGAFCVLNGQFFYMQESPAPLALPLKTGGNILSEGFGYPQYPEKQLMLALWGDRADILPLTQENLYGTDAPDVLGGLDPQANKKPKNTVGRTFLGILDGNGDGIFETILILATQTATQAAADKTLRSFGAVKVMMLDGGGSTQLVCDGRAYIDTTRVLPQAIGVAATQGSNVANTGLSAQVAAPVAAELSTANQTAFLAASPPVQTSVPVEAPPPQGATSVSGQMPSSAVFQASGVPAGDNTSTESVTDGTVNPPGAEAGANPDSQAAAVAQFDAENSRISIADYGSSTSPPEVSQLSMLAGALPGSVAQKQAGFIPPNSSRAGQAGGFNAGDVLWLPAVIPPLSLFILFAFRRRNRPGAW